MKVKIKLGSYGHRAVPGEPMIELKDCNSKPFEVEDAEAERIIGLGIAEAVDESDVIKIDIDKSENDSGVVYGTLSRESLADMDVKSLRQLAKDLELDSKGTKEDLINRIVNEKVEIPTEEEQPPVLEAAEPEV